ncbi:SDR family NAD(P)-dependent oxidoreductase [Adhaeribacter radiodurans]|uniref:SDR family oxidoreductase n=1 Tax=Adhaeribacter radiodurans TaxID=2745197 RepID=A0A7L7L209_9BACT|nr:SDR family oxidoreductase [Adhaeribacter radiodurans]QMU26828.1 SDR family oxidoreductase [Adhaeribacter radiodurans]
METVQNQTVLITGASSGIGFELARLFARDNYHIIMVAHHVDKLDHAAWQLQSEFSNVRLNTIAIDLSKDDAPSRLFNHVQQQGWQINVLVNNAGFGEYGLFAESNLEKELAMIHLNIIALVHLTKLFLPYLLNQGSGKILQVGSVASFTPTPLQSVYGATKAFILSFSEALQEELKDSPVSVTILCPPATDTNFFNVAGAQNSKIAQGDLATPEEVASTAYKALLAGDKRAVPTFKAKIQVAQSAILPDALNATLMHKQSEETTKPKKSSSKKTSTTTVVSESAALPVTEAPAPVTATRKRSTKSSSVTNLDSAAASVAAIDPTIAATGLTADNLTASNTEAIPTPASKPKRSTKKTQ